MVNIQTIVLFLESIGNFQMQGNFHNSRKHPLLFHFHPKDVG